MNLASFFLEQVEKKADEPACFFHEKSIDYWTLGKKVKGFANHLKSLGVTPGTKVAILLPNVPEFCVAVLACWSAGCVAVTINPLYKEREIAFILEQGDVAIVLSQKGNEEVKKAVGKLHHIEVKALGASMADLPQHSGELSLDTYEVALMIFTNAEDGSPKAAQLTHESLYADVQSCYAASDPIGAEEVVMGALPLYHGFGLMTCLLYAFAQGGKCVLVPRFKIDEMLKVIENRRITFFTGVPTMFASLCMGKTEKSSAFAHSRIIISGGAPLTDTVYQRFLDLYGKPILQGYGLTEASPVVSLNPQDGSHKPLSVGKPMPGIKVSIVNKEVVVQGKNIMKGYYKDKEATVKVLQSDGLHTGDKGFLDEDGFLFLTGLKKRMLIMGGFNVYLKEVEEVLLSHPQIKKATVFPVEDFLFYQLPAARLQVEGTISEREVVAFARKHLANYKVPRKITIEAVSE